MYNPFERTGPAHYAHAVHVCVHAVSVFDVEDQTARQEWPVMQGEDRG
jgi:hypothetical protein